MSRILLSTPKFLIQIMLFSKIAIIVLLSVAGARNMSTRELIVRIKFCQAKTCNKCAKMLKSYNTFKMANVSLMKQIDCNTHISPGRPPFHRMTFLALSNAVHYAEMLQT